MDHETRFMKTNGISRIAGAVFVLTAAALFHPLSARACAACYGQSDAPIARGMNWGILSLLGVVGMVLGILSSFFVFLAKRSASFAAASAAAPASVTQPTESQHELG
jgi:hypothetical protein